MASSPSLKAVERTARRRASAEAEFRASVFRAHTEGESLRAIGKAAGLAHTRVLQIVREA